MCMHNPAHLGEIIERLCLESVSQKQLKYWNQSEDSIGDPECRAGISLEMSVRLSMVLGTSAESWLNHQALCDLWSAR